MARARFVALSLLLCVPSAFADSPVDPGKPLSPEDGLKSIRVKEGFEVELVAAEPMVMDPVAIAWGPDGKLWVVEMADYPVGADGNPAPPNGSRVRYLEDSDDDGKYDKSMLFMEGVSFPNGILPWRKGVLVTAAPEIFFAEDTNGDGKADRKEVLYTGFTEGNPQLRINGLRWGLDNWVYCANGWSSRGKVKSTRTGAEVEVSGRDIRIRPDTGEIETVEGMTEFGRERDDWGDWFGCDNAHPMWHYVLPERYTKRNPHVPPPDPREQLLKPFPPKVYAASRRARRYNAFDIQDHFQSACSAVVYRDELLFEREPDKRHAFVCDPVHNLIHHAILTESGVTFTAARAQDEKDREFFASTDNWCRPVMALAGPDGALWVVDMYRFMIEHPEYLPDVGRKELSPHYRLGEDRGRIYRVFPKGQPPRQVPRMDRWRTIELCRAAMDSPSGWQRDMGQMLLLWNAQQMRGEARGELTGVVYGSQNPLARNQALGALEGLERVSPANLVAGLADEHPAVRRQALRLAEAQGAAPEVLDAALKLVEDPDPKVRLQLAFSLGAWQGTLAGEALGKLANGPDGNDPYVAAAVVSSAPTHARALAAALLSPGGRQDGLVFRGLLRTATAMNDGPLTTMLLEPVLAPPNGVFTSAKFQALADWVEGAGSRGLRVSESPPWQQKTRAIYAAAEHAATDASNPVEARVAALALFGRRAEAQDREAAALADMLSPRTPPELQRAAVAAAGRLRRELVPGVLLANWPAHSPELRGLIADELIRHPQSASALLDAVAVKKVAPAEIDLPRRQRLLKHDQPYIRQRAEKLLAEGAAAANRQKAIDGMRPALEMRGDAKRGAAVYREQCAVCHRLDDVGQDVGPNLAAVREWTGEALLAGILDPNRQAEPKYIAYTATTAVGESIFGVVASEGAESVTMKGLDGKDRPVPRTELKSLVSTNRSLMPDGFESAINSQQMADLIAFLKAPEAAK